MPPFIQDFLARAAARTSIAIIDIGLSGSSNAEATSGLDDAHVAWWLADSRRVVHEEDVAALEPPWSCPICAEGVEAEGSNGWVVQICGPNSDDKLGSPSDCSDAKVHTKDEPTAADGGASAASSSSAAADGSPVQSQQMPLDFVGDVHAVEGEQEVARLDPQGHVYHETCLRRWLVKSNSCPVCRRSPVVPEET